MYRDAGGYSYTYAVGELDEDGVCTVTLTVTTDTGSSTVVYDVYLSTGYIWFNIEDGTNDYAAVLAYGGRLDLAEGMIEATRSINSSFLSGRTIQ